MNKVEQPIPKIWHDGAGYVAEFDILPNKKIRICFYNFRSTSSIIIKELDQKSKDWQLCDISNLSNSEEIISDAASLYTSKYSWDTSEYISLCRRIGIDPTINRPRFPIEYYKLGMAIVDHLAFNFAARGIPAMEWRWFAFDVVDLLREDIRPDIALYSKVWRQADRWLQRPFGPEIQAALADFDVTRCIARTGSYASIRFLPSAEGAGFDASISGWGGDFGPEDWAASCYSSLHGIALEPEDDGPWTQIVRTRLTEQGVVFLSHAEAEAYLDGEGAYWAHKHRDTRSFDNIQMRRPTLWEKLKWHLV